MLYGIDIWTLRTCRKMYQHMEKNPHPGVVGRVLGIIVLHENIIIFQTHFPSTWYKVSFKNFHVVLVIHGSPIKHKLPTLAALIVPQSFTHPPPYLTLRVRFLESNSAFFLHTNHLPSESRIEDLSWIRMYSSNFWKIWFL